MLNLGHGKSHGILTSHKCTNLSKYNEGKSYKVINGTVLNLSLKMISSPPYCAFSRVCLRFLCLFHVRHHKM